MKKESVMLFISKGANYLMADQESFKEILKEMSRNELNIKVIDTCKEPHLAEKYKIEALPTLVINNKKYIGQPSPRKVIEIFRNIHL